jgi:predicted O-linked N-acetylglucosamine transferase (SPINDLY family)
MAQLTVQQAFDLALQHHQAGRLREAEQLYRQILAQQPRHADAMHLLGVIAHQAGRHDAGADLIRAAITLQPNWPEAHSNLGEALRCAGHLDQAITAHRQALALRPGDTDALNNLGIALRDKGQLDEAIAVFGQAIALMPNYVEAHNNLGIALRTKGQLDDAIAAYHRAIALRPNYAEAHSNLGNALKDNGQPDAAIAAYRKAIALRPDYPEAHSYLANVLKDMGRLDEALAACREAIALMPDHPDAHSSLLFTMHFHPDYDARTIAEEHRRWSRLHAEPLKKLIRPHLNDRNPHRRLRIGYVSPDFRDHVVARFFLPLLANHDKSQVEVFAYAQVARPDVVTQMLGSLVDGWRNIVGLSDAQAAELIRADQIDILVDLAGHTAGNRLPLMARKPAPVQVTYLGYPNTTGLTSIDYRFTDDLADPPGQTESLHCEQLVRLPDGIWCHVPDPEPPPVAPLPALAKGAVTFGSFNQWPKINSRVLRLWTKVLGQVPGSTLLIKDRSSGGPLAHEKAREILAEEGISKDRLRILDRAATHGQHLMLYDEMDIALDTFPYHGTGTTFDALWMGLPVVTLAGSTHVSRVGVSLLNRMGLSELVAQTPEQYVQIAAKLAANLPRLRELRQGLRQRMEQSPLMNAPKFARNVEAAYRGMWRAWCENVSRS